MIQQQFCAPQASSRNLYWNSTRAGQVARQACPDGATGSASWICDFERLRFVPLLSPDFSQCNSIWLARLARQLDQMLEASPSKQVANAELGRQQDERTIRMILEELNQMAQTKLLFGEDLKRIDIMISQMIAQLRSLSVITGGWRSSAFSDGPGNSIQEELFAKLASIVSSLFDPSKRSAWLELQPAEASRRLEGRLLNHLKESGLMLANSMGSSGGEPVMYANILAGITVINSNNGDQALRAANWDGSTGELNLFTGNRQQLSPLLNRFAMSVESFSDLGEQSQSEFRLQTALLKELLSNGKFAELILLQMLL